MRAIPKARAGVFLIAIAAAFGAHGHAHHQGQAGRQGQADQSGDVSTSHRAAHSGHANQPFPDPATAAAPEGVVAGACWIRALPNPLPMAAYFSLENQGDHGVVLVGAQSDGFGNVMLHTHVDSGGMSSMKHLDRVPVEPGEGLEFAPGGHHVMLQQPRIALEVGSQHVITLWFEGDRALPVRCDVRPAGTTSGATGS